MNILRRLPLSRLLLLCALVVAIGVSATAIASAVDSGPTPPAKPLAQAVHDTLAGAQGAHIEGLSANIQLTDHLLEGASLASGGGGGGGGGGGLTSSPLVTGASGRLWIAKDGRVRLELQSQKGDTQIVYDGHTVTLYDAATNTVYRYTPPAGEQEASKPAPASQHHEIPSVAKIEEAIAHANKHADISGATPTDVAGQPAYTVRVSPKEGGSLLGGAELSWDASNGVPLRAAIYSSTSSSPVIELAASEVSFGPVESSVFAITPPANAKVQEITFSEGHHEGASKQASAGEKPKVTTHGHGLGTIAVLESKSDGATGTSKSLEGLPKVTIDGSSASELRTELGTLLTFERSGVRYLVGGAVSPAAVEEVARGL
ncbi:MAG: outer rane lipoprotein carrier protein LolA [Solirubrobacterales bacterium]|nr:outer rane lipoprotein carrier protein LolA [Solirubrobacterales bacterium]